LEKYSDAKLIEVASHWKIRSCMAMKVQWKIGSDEVPVGSSIGLNLINTKANVYMMSVTVDYLLHDVSYLSFFFLVEALSIHLYFLE